MRRVTVYYYVEPPGSDGIYWARVAAVSWKHFESSPVPVAKRAVRRDAVEALRNMIKEQLRLVTGDRLTLRECD